MNKKYATQRMQFLAAFVLLALTACASAAPAPSSTPSLDTGPTQPHYTLPFSEPGSYSVGTREFTFVDESRGGRSVSIQVWYPAIPPRDSESRTPVEQAAPDLSVVPYPIILSSGKIANLFAAHMASYGFFAVGVQGQDSANQWGNWLIDYPLDLLFALNQVAGGALNGLEGIADTSRVGAMGYSFDGYTSLALSGARVDPDFYQVQCGNAEQLNPAPEEWWVEYICAPAADWEAFAQHAGSAITTSADGLWQPITDRRILAVMPMAPEGAWLFGEQGLAAADRPVFIIDGTEDDINYYNLEAAYIYEHLGTPDRTLISFIGQDHMMVYSSEMVARMKHFAVAFFGVTLQQREDYAAYYSKEFISQYIDLAWGVYPAP